MWNKLDELRKTQIAVDNAKTEVLRLQIELSTAQVNAQKDLDNNAKDYFWAFKLSNLKKDIEVSEYHLHQAEQNHRGTLAS